jgi:competence protein ComFC
MWKKNLRDWWGELLFPRCCINCGRWGELWCEQCYSKLNFLVENKLEAVTASLATDDQPAFLDQLQALLAYDQLTAKLIRRYKYRGARDVGEMCGYWLWQFLAMEKVDVITFVPLHRKRWLERGYNQAKLIAEELARRSGIPCQSLLVRTKYASKQALSKNKAERLSKTKDIFAVRPKIKLPLTALVVDDVVTTGATLNEVARVLKAAGVERVSAVAVAHGS